MEDKTMLILAGADILRRVTKEGETQSGRITYTDFNGIFRTSK